MEEYIEEIMQSLVGKKITFMRYMNDEEMAKFGWSKRPIMILIEGGTLIIPQSDDEGNEGGAMIVVNNNFNVIPTY
jgi:hypothetical protein